MHCGCIPPQNSQVTHSQCPSQFYITFKETRHLDGKHVVFGRLVSGLAVLRKIAAVDTNSQDCPRSHVIIERCGSIQLLGDGEQVDPAPCFSHCALQVTRCPTG